MCDFTFDFTYLLYLLAKEKQVLTTAVIMNEYTFLIT